jgi:hypothetical protein
VTPVVRLFRGERTFRAISGGVWEPIRLQQGFAALGISGGPPSRKAIDLLTLFVANRHFPHEKANHPF